MAKFGMQMPSARAHRGAGPDVFTALAVIAFLALGTAMALAGLKEWWQRVVLVMLAIPVALLLNVLRIAVLGVAVQYNPDLATGEAHMLIGTFLLVPGFAAYLFIRWALIKSVSAGEGKRAKGARA